MNTNGTRWKSEVLESTCDFIYITHIYMYVYIIFISRNTYIHLDLIYNPLVIIYIIFISRNIFLYIYLCIYLWV